MKIASSNLALQSDHAAFMHDQRSETLRTWRGERPDFKNNSDTAAANQRSITARISAAAWQALTAATSAPTIDDTGSAASAANAIEAASDAADNDPFLALVKRMVEMLTGEEVRIFDMKSFAADMRHVETSSTSASTQARANNSGRAGYGIEYEYHAVHEEAEATHFAAQGVVHTADGQEINFQLDLSMTRYYREETNISWRAGDAVRKDPLVVNFGGTATQLADQANQRFSFDIDGDGNAESLPLFASGSGFLALDLNGNGRIDSGKELFGPQSGNGFTDLAVLDSDGNGWIDENDAAFKDLAVWTPAAEGDGTLQSLTDLGIGALALAHVETPFALRGGHNSDLGLVKSSGIYLTESGLAGTLQEVDLTV